MLLNYVLFYIVRTKMRKMLILSSKIMGFEMKLTWVQILNYMTIFCFYDFQFPYLERERRNDYIFLIVLCQMYNIFEICMKAQSISNQLYCYFPFPGLKCELSRFGFYLCGPYDWKSRIIILKSTV